MRVIDAPGDPDWHGVIVGEIRDIPGREDVVLTFVDGRVVEKGGPDDPTAETWEDQAAMEAALRARFHSKPLPDRN